LIFDAAFRKMAASASFRFASAGFFEKMFQPSTRVTVRSSALALAAALVACSSVQQFRTRVLDEVGRPLPGTVVYEETFVPGDRVRHVDFTWAVADAEGWAPSQSEQPVSLRTAFRSCSLVAILVPGRLPQVSMEHAPCPGSNHPAVRELRLGDPGARVPFDFRYIGFPFLGEAELREKARSPAAQPLRAAFRSSALLLQAKEASLGREMIMALDALDRSR
jgi:hypothetical protein